VDYCTLGRSGLRVSRLTLGAMTLGLDESRMLVATKVRLRTGSGPNDVGLGRPTSCAP